MRFHLVAAEEFLNPEEATEDSTQLILEELNVHPHNGWLNWRKLERLHSNGA